jgi:hypothetical protein
MAIILMILAGAAYAQTYQNQPTVMIYETQPNVTYYTGNGTFNIVVTGYIMVNNTDITNTLYDVNLSYQSLPSQFTIQQVGAYYYNQSGRYSRPNTNLIQSLNLIHINEIPRGGAYQILYTITGTNLQASDGQIIPGTNMPNLANVTESVYLKNQYDPQSNWINQNITYQPSIMNFTLQNPLTVGDQIRVTATLTNVDPTTSISGIQFRKQLPFGNDSTGNATGHITNFSYWSSTIPYQNLTGIQPDPATGMVNFTILQSLPPGDTLYISFDGYFTEINGTELPPGSGTRYITINPAYIKFSQTKGGVSYLGSYINNASQGWISAGGDTNMTLVKGYNGLSNKWQFRVLVKNPTNTSFNITTVNVLRNNYATTPDLQTAVPVWNSSSISVTPGGGFDSGYITDTLYNGNNNEPPVYWVTYRLDVYPLIVGSPSNYQQSITMTSSSPANFTVPEPYLRLSQWQVQVTKLITFNDLLGEYVINISVTNIGFSDTPGNTRLYDFIPINFSANGFIKSNTTLSNVSYVPDYNVVSLPVIGPKTIGWNLYILEPQDTANFSYVAQGVGNIYSSSGLYVIGADPSNVIGALTGGLNELRVSAGGMGVELIMAVLLIIILSGGLLRRLL